MDVGRTAVNRGDFDTGGDIDNYFTYLKYCEQ